MSTRCPAWCDRVLMSHDLKSKLIQKNNPDSNPDSNSGKDDNSIVNYDVIGKNDFIIFTKGCLSLFNYFIDMSPILMSPFFVEKKTRALSELPANWPSLTSLTG